MSGTAQLRSALSGAPAGQAKPMNKYDVFKGKLEGARHDLRAYLGSDKAVARFISTCVSAVVGEATDAGVRHLQRGRPFRRVPVERNPPPGRTQRPAEIHARINPRE